ELHGGSLARPPTTPPPKVGPYPGTSGERAQWWWYDPYQPPPPAKN
ncbi:MAG: HNH endonuclease, partial [Mycolicibacterium sp.]